MDFRKEIEQMIEDCDFRVDLIQLPLAAKEWAESDGLAYLDEKRAEGIKVSFCFTNPNFCGVCGSTSARKVLNPGASPAV